MIQLCLNNVFLIIYMELNEFFTWKNKQFFFIVPFIFPKYLSYIRNVDNFALVLTIINYAGCQQIKYNFNIVLNL